MRIETETIEQVAVRPARVEWADAAKGLSILLVVFHHAFLASRDLDQQWHLLATLDQLFKPIRMPLFFTIAGMFASRATGRSWAQLLNGRIATLIYLYSLWTAIYWLFFRYFDPTDGAKALGLSKWQIIFMWIIPPGGQWFLWLLAIYLTVAKAIAPWRGPSSLALVFLISILSAPLIDDIPVYSWRNALLYLSFFLTGCWYGPALLNRLPRLAVPLMIVGIPATSWLWSLPDSGWRAYGLSIAGAAAAIGAVIAARRLPRLIDALSFFGRRSLAIYLGHGLVIAALTMLLSALPLPDHAYIWIVPLLSLFSLYGAMLMEDGAGVVGRRWFYSAEGLREWLVQRRPVKS